MGDLYCFSNNLSMLVLPAVIWIIVMLKNIYYIYLYAQITLDNCHAFHLYGLRRAVENGKQAKTLKGKCMYPVGFRPTTFHSERWHIRTIGHTGKIHLISFDWSPIHLCHMNKRKEKNQCVTKHVPNWCWLDMDWNLLSDKICILSFFYKCRN